MINPIKKNNEAKNSIWIKRMLIIATHPKAANPSQSDLEKNKYLLQANGSTIKFDGYLKVYGDKLPVTENISWPRRMNPTALFFATARNIP